MRQKKCLAFELTKLVHGEEEAVKAQEGARALFSSGNAAQMPETKLVDEDFEDGKIGILKLMVKAGLATSNGEARRNVEQGGVTIDGESDRCSHDTYERADQCRRHCCKTW